ncbi:hypothetical protein GSI_12745 [Ganoderma sinense ZZ0214-1]|uniref:Transporter n=1 Tax=Ganoderma sinense ZZ0214-1 TaxID=1077348 RepID=A0A2G8RU48_9APHY|nr:hypothetical protein GSI_12745 [Ganoderma sinense ZZ0214-1]
MLENPIDSTPMIPRLSALLIFSLPLLVAAQNDNNPFDNGSGTPGAVIAGVVVAICIAILFLILFGLMFRRRRRAATVLPQYSSASGVPESNQNQGPYLSYPMNQQQAWGGHHSPPRPPREEFAPPPPYPGKREPDGTEENSGYGYPNPPPPDNGVLASGGFINPSNPHTHTPPPAHVPAHSNPKAGPPY